MNTKREKIYPASVSEHNSNCEKQVIYLIISNAEGWRYLAVKKLSALSIEITSKYKSYFYCLSCLNSFKTKKKLESRRKVCGNKDFCNIVIPFEYIKIIEFNILIPSEDTKILEFNKIKKKIFKIKF